MKAIKIVSENASAIVAALVAVNGRATAHSTTSYGEVEDVATQSEKRLSGLFAKKYFRGAVAADVSGARVPNAYGYSCRVATRIKIERKTDAWFLIEVSQTQIFQNGGSYSLYLTADQDKAAVSRLRGGYSVKRALAPVAVPEAIAAQ